MNKINVNKELKFISSEKFKTKDKEGLLFQLLNVAHVIITNYINAKTKKMKGFYKMVYLKTKEHYLEKVSRQT